jgi:hypothetical protein
MDDYSGNYQPTRDFTSDITSDIISHWSKQSGRLPSLTELRGLLDEPLPEGEKVPLDIKDFEQFLSSLPHDICTSDHVRILFRVSESERSLSLRSTFMTIITTLTPPDSGSEASFHQLWDDHIRRILELLLPNGVTTPAPKS